MDDVDSQMQTEASSQAGSVTDRMDLEHEDTPAVTRDAEMEIHDPAAEGTAEEMRDALIEDDAEMAAEMMEQEMKTEEQGWGDRDADIEVVDVEETLPDAVTTPEQAGREGGNGIAAESTEQAQETQEMLQTGLEEGGVTEATDATTIGHSAEDALPDHQLEKGQLTLEETTTSTDSANNLAPQDKPEQNRSRDSQADEIEPVQYDVLNPGGKDGEVTARDDDKQVEDVLKPTNETEEEEERYADVQIETNEADVQEASQVHQATDISTIQRPALQKDFLSHIDLFSSQPPSAPHVSLICDNASYSLFRASSSPSGDDEHVLFPSSEEGSGDHELYFGTLDKLIQTLHEAFPGLRGDGENEIILDFGILDMQISEDNVYTKQLSLYDIDRIRLGMSQPELDRLQINLIVGKRFVYRFNELAEHCYRMYTGSEEDDSGTIQDYHEDVDDQDETVDEPLQDYNEEEIEASHESQEQVNPDYTTEENVQDLDQEELRKLHDQEQEHEQNGQIGEEGSGDAGEQGEYEEEEEELHPPSDEHYEDPEFSQEIEDGDCDDAAEINGASESHHDKESDTVKQEQENQSKVEDEEAGELLDLDAPLLEAAEEAEEYEEAAFEEEEGAQAEAEADANTEETVTLQDPAVSRPTHQPDRTEQERDYYESLDSLAGEEEIVLVEKPDPAPVLEKYAAELEDTRAAQAGDPEDANGEDEGLEEVGKKITRSSSKRNREELLDDGAGADLDQTLPELDDNSGDPKRAKISINI